MLWGVLDGEITGEGDGPGRGDGVGEELDLYSRDSVIEVLLFFPQNLISCSGAYGTSFTPVGITQYAVFWVTVRVPDTNSTLNCKQERCYMSTGFT